MGWVFEAHGFWPLASCFPRIIVRCARHHDPVFLCRNRIPRHSAAGASKPHRIAVVAVMLDHCEAMPKTLRDGSPRPPRCRTNAKNDTTARTKLALWSEGLILSTLSRDHLSGYLPDLALRNLFSCGRASSAESPPWRFPGFSVADFFQATVCGRASVSLTWPR